MHSKFSLFIHHPQQNLNPISKTPFCFIFNNPPPTPPPTALTACIARYFHGISHLAKGQGLCCLELKGRPSVAQTQSVYPVGYMACGPAGTAHSLIDLGRKEEGRAWSVSAVGYIGVQIDIVGYYYCESCEGLSGE